MIPAISPSKAWILPVVALIVLSIAHRGTAIMCWECNSRYDPDCRDPFNNRSIALADCDQRTYSLAPLEKATICRKIVQKISDEYRYVRSCGWLKEVKEGQDCIKRAGTFHVQVQYCQCHENGCNSAPTLRTSRLASLAAIVLAFIGPFRKAVK